MESEETGSGKCCIDRFYGMRKEQCSSKAFVSAQETDDGYGSSNVKETGKLDSGNF